MKVESIKDYIDVLSEEELMSLANKIYTLIDFVKADYLNHKEWFYHIQLPETLHSNKRNILFVKDKDEVIAIANLHKDKTEKKISSLYVKSEYQRQGIGSMLVEESMKWLHTKYPIISIVKERYPIYKPLVEKYHWKLTRTINGFYKEGVEELFFNVPESNTKYQ